MMKAKGLRHCLGDEVHRMDLCRRFVEWRRRGEEGTGDASGREIRKENAADAGSAKNPVQGDASPLITLCG